MIVKSRSRFEFSKKRLFDLLGILRLLSQIFVIEGSHVSQCSFCQM